MKLGLLLLAAVAFGQTPEPPAPPACLSGPVTKGTVTVSCAALDGVSIAVPTSGVGQTILAVRVASTDPEVMAVRIEVTWVQDNFPGASAPTRKLAAIALKGTLGVFGTFFSLTPSFDASGNPSPTLITGVSVQELKASSSSPF